MSDQRCKLCEEPLPVRALHFSNEAAIQSGYCSYFCLLSDLGKEEAMRVLQEFSKDNPGGIRKVGQS